MYDADRRWPGQFVNPDPDPTKDYSLIVGSKYTQWNWVDALDHSKGGWWSPTDSSELIRSVLIGTNGSGVVDRVYVLADVFLRTASVPTLYRRDYALHKYIPQQGSWVEDLASIGSFRSKGNIYDFGSNADQGYPLPPDGPPYDSKTDGQDRLGGAVLSNDQSKIYTIGTCYWSNPADYTRRFTVSSFDSASLSHLADSDALGSTSGNLIQGEGNAIALDAVRNRLFVVGAKDIGSPSDRDIAIAEYDISNGLSFVSRYVITRTGDDVAYYLSIRNVSSTSTRLVISGVTDTVTTGVPGTLTYGLTETAGVWTQNWSHAIGSSAAGGVRNDGITVSPSGADVYLVTCEGGVVGDDQTVIFHLNGNGSGAISADWTATIDCEMNPGSNRLASANIDGGFQADGNGNLWITWRAYREYGSNSYDTRVAAWSNSGAQLISNFYNSASNYSDSPALGVLDPRAGTTKFYVVGNTQNSNPIVRLMQSGNSTLTALTYPLSQPSPNPNTWAPGLDVWYPATASLSLAGRATCAIKGGTGITFNGQGGRSYNCVLAVARANRAATDDWQDGSESLSNKRKYRLHNIELTLFGIN